MRLGSARVSRAGFGVAPKRSFRVCRCICATLVVHGKLLFALSTWRRQLRNFGDIRRSRGTHASTRARFGSTPKRPFLELRLSSVPIHLKKLAIARRARQHASRVRYPDIGRYTSKDRQERMKVANVRK